MKILLLGGTAEARKLAPLLAGQGHDVIASLAGVTGSPLSYGVPTRVGGFGGVVGLTHWLIDRSVDLLIDATHPFASQMPVNARKAAMAADVPHLRLLRPGWPFEPGWQYHDRIHDAVLDLPTKARVLVTTGQTTLEPLRERTDVTFLLRVIESPGALPAHIEPLINRPPLSRAKEDALMAKHAITHLLTKDSGGNPAKLIAAAKRGVTVLMIRRPSLPECAIAATVPDAVAWIARNVGS